MVTATVVERAVLCLIVLRWAKRWKRHVDQIRGCDSSVNLRGILARSVPIVAPAVATTIPNSNQTGLVEVNQSPPIDSEVLPKVGGEDVRVDGDEVRDGDEPRESKTYPVRNRRAPELYGYNKEGGV